VRLNLLQQELEALYDVQGVYRVEDFLLTDRELATSAGRDVQLGETPEALLVREHREGLDVALFLEAELVQRLHRDNPARALHDGNLEDFLTAVEGVSHFLYLVWNARLGRSVSQLELELQAEVDKYVAASLWISRQYGRRPLADLHHALFRRIRFREGLSEERLARYDRANRLAGRYCAAIERVLGAGGAGRGAMPELRRFYRMTQGRKIDHIERLDRSLRRAAP
jgi:hypothetical protein